MVDFGEPGGVYSVLLEDAASDKRLDVGSVISSTVPLELQKTLSILKSLQVLACLVSQGR